MKAALLKSLCEYVNIIVDNLKPVLCV